MKLIPCFRRGLYQCDNNDWRCGYGLSQRCLSWWNSKVDKCSACEQNDWYVINGWLDEVENHASIPVLIQLLAESCQRNWIRWLVSHYFCHFYRIDSLPIYRTLFAAYATIIGGFWWRCKHTTMVIARMVVNLVNILRKYAEELGSLVRKSATRKGMVACNEAGWRRCFIWPNQ